VSHLNLLAGPQAVGALAGSGIIELEANLLETGGDGSSSVFDGAIHGEGGALTKKGSGTLTLNGPNSYSGPTKADEGTLLVNGIQPQSQLLIGEIGKLGGAGTVGSILNANGGVIAPGASAGILTCRNVSISGEFSDFTVELNGLTPGSTHDQLKVLGDVVLNGATLNVTVGYPSTPGDTFTIIDNDGSDPVVGRFNALPEGTLLTSGDVALRISYTGGTGNDVTLTVVSLMSSLGSLAYGPGNQFRVMLTGQPGVLYVIEANTNLSTADWIACFTNTAPFTFIETDTAGFPQRFYRARAVP
jgi:autotransporter-associated beta strand protein